MENKVLEVSHENFVSMAHDLIEVADNILRSVVQETEKAALSIGEKIQSVSHLNEEQSEAIKKLLANLYTQGTPEQLEISQETDETNDFVEQILNSAQQGDLEEARKVGSSPRYLALQQRSSALATQLEKFSESDRLMGEMIMPVIMALQFQDSVRQSLENVIKCFDLFFNATSCIAHDNLPTGIASEFWKKIEKQFTNLHDRNVVRTVVYGADAKQEDAVESGDAIFL